MPLSFSDKNSLNYTGCTVYSATTKLGCLSSIDHQTINNPPAIYAFVGKLLKSQPYTATNEKQSSKESVL